ncbi:MAG TPA: hypothetical protein VGO68_20120 [Pyrinomonadaceae bacterium]|jgi:hypothetical protein|nr:hypothetical protein [Pyrinomonadaceae bacterium]
MKLICLSLGSWLIAVAAIFFMFVVVEGGSLNTASLQSATITSLAIAALLFSLSYAPSLFWLRKRLGGCRPAAIFPLASALVINLPVFLIGILSIGRTLVAAEAFAFIGAFVLMGTTFGVAFVWNYRSGDIKSARWNYLKPFRNPPAFQIRQTLPQSLISMD